MNIKILYMSKKHTKKVAEAMAQTLGVPAQRIEDADLLQKTELLFLGFGIYGGNPPQKLNDFLAKLKPENIQNIVLFTTSARGKDQTAPVREKLQAQGLNVAEKTFSGKGRFLFMNSKEPGRETLEAAQRFASETVKQEQKRP